MEEVMCIWSDSWKKSPRCPKLSKIDPKMPSKRFRSLTAPLSRPQPSILVQLRTGRLPLNGYLHRISKAPSPLCSTCRQALETVHHFLIDCPTWRHERWHVAKKLGRDAKSLSRLLNTRKGIGEVFKFVGQTGRFKANYGDFTVNI